MMVNFSNAEKLRMMTTGILDTNLEFQSLAQFILKNLLMNDIRKSPFSERRSEVVLSKFGLK